MVETFEIKLGPKTHYPRVWNSAAQQHNPNDFHQEVLIDFAISEGASLGWLAAIYERHGAEIDH